MRRILLLLLVGAALGGCSSRSPMVATSSPSAAPPDPARWTVMFYCACDNDLEQATMDNLRDVSTVGGSSEVSLVALVDRAKLGHSQEGYSDEPLGNLPHWSGAKLLQIEPGEFRELADWGQVNMADGAVLTRFVLESMGRFPARHYALVLLDHGDAWAGVCVDDGAKEPDDLLRPAELQAALRKAGFGSSKPLDLLVFDACLMANLELLTRLREQVRLVVASEEIVPLAGLHYANTLASLNRGLWKEGDEAVRLGKDLVFQNKPALNDELTHLVLLRMDRLEALERLVEDLARRLTEKLQRSPRTTWLSLARARAASQDFGHSELPLVPNAEVRDILDLCRHLGAVFPDLAALCRDIEKAERSLPMAQVRSQTLPHAQGVTIFFPPQLESAHELASADYFTLVPPQLTHWSEMVRTYTQLERDDSTRPVLAKVQASASLWERGEVLQLQSRLSRPQELKNCQFLISQKDLILGCLPSFPDDNSTLVHDEFDGTSLVVSDGSGSLFCPLGKLDENFRGKSQDQVFVSLPAQFRKANGGDWIDISLIFCLDLSRENFEGQLFRVLRRGKRAAVSLQKGDALRLLYESVNRAPPQPSSALILSQPAKLGVTSRPLPAGEYLMGYRIEDFSGRTALQTTKIKVAP